MAVELPPQAWFATVEFHDEAFSRENVLISCEHIPGCTLSTGTLARVAAFRSNVAPTDFQNVDDNNSANAAPSRPSSRADDDNGPRTASRSTRQTARNSRGNESQVHNFTDMTKSLVFVVSALSAEQKAKRPALQISLHMSLKHVLGFSNRQQVVITPTDSGSSTASFVELAFRDQYLARADMWQLTVSELSHKAVFRGQEIQFMGAIKATIKSIFVRGRKVTSALIRPATVPIFRSESARYVFFVQMSAEMWDFDSEGSGELMFNKVINGFLPDLFKRWVRLGVKHLVNIVLFTRLEYQKGILKDTGVDAAATSKVQKDGHDVEHELDYRDFYKVVTTDTPSKDWVKILFELRREFKVFLRDTLIIPGSETYGRKPDTLAEVKDAKEVECVIAGRPTVSSKGNVLEAINLASSQFAQDYIDRDLLRTGISLIILTAGTGVFEVDYNMLKLTTDTLIGNGIGIDLVSIAPMPLHSVPLFRYRTPHILAKTAMGSSGVGSYNHVGSTPRNPSVVYPRSSSPIKLHSTRNDAGISSAEMLADITSTDTQWSYALPHWIDISFWSGESDESLQKSTGKRLVSSKQGKSGFAANCTMYELQAMGLMESEMTDIAISFLRVRPTLMDDQLRNSFQDLQTRSPSESKSSSKPSTAADAELSQQSSLASPEKAVMGARKEEDPARQTLMKWMDQYDHDIFHGTRWDLISQMQISSKGVRLVDTTSNLHKGGNSYQSSKNILSTSPDVQRRQPLPSSRLPITLGRDNPDSNADSDSSSIRSSKPSQTSTDKPKRKAMPRQFSLGPKGLGPMKTAASISISSTTAETVGATETKKAAASPAKTSGLLTQQLRNTLRRKPSQQTIASYAPSVVDDSSSISGVAPSNPISIGRNTDTFGDEETDNMQQSATVKPSTAMRVQEEARITQSANQAAKSSSFTSASFQNRFGIQGGLSPLRAMSPWLTMLNPSNPKKENMSIASQFRRWQHVFPKAIPTSAIKWKSLCSPAALPLTSEYFPTADELRDQYDENPYTVSVQDHQELTEAPETRETLLRQMIAARLSNGFQIVIGKDAETFSRSHGSALLDCFEPEMITEDASTVLMSVGNNFHQLICLDKNHIEVRRFIRKPVQMMESEGILDPSVVYQPRLRTMLAEIYEKREFIFRNPRSKYDWSTIDQYISDRDYELSPDLRYWRARFVLIPVDPPKSSRGPLAPVAEASDEEIRLEGIQRLTQIWQRYRYIHPEDRRFQASVQHRRKDPNPLAIDYQTRDPSMVARAYAGRHAEMGMSHPELQGPLFAEDQLYHTNDFDIQKLSQHIQAEPPKGLNVVDRRWHWKVYQRCFRGDELTTWLLMNFKDLDAREDAVKLGNELMKKGLFTHVQHKHHFRDGNYFYQISSEYRMTHHPDQKGSWFSKMTDRSTPNTPLLTPLREIAKHYPEPSKSKLGSDESSESSGHSTPHREKKRLELSRVLQYDVDSKKRSWRPEIINLHYDRIHNPENCYHIRIEWMNVTSKLIEDAITTWATSAERYGLKLVGVPIGEACTITERHPFRAPYKITLAVPPPAPKTKPHHDHGLHSSQHHEDKHVFQKAILRKWDFVLDLEAASNFDADVEVTYSWGVPSYKHTQFIHRSGTLLAEIHDDGSFLILANRMAGNRSSITISTAPRLDRRTTQTVLPHKSPFASPLVKAADVPSTPQLSAAKNPTTKPSTSFTDLALNGEEPSAFGIKDVFEKFCHNERALEDFYEEVLARPSASPSPRVGPVPGSPRHTPLLRGVLTAFGGSGSSIGQNQRDKWDREFKADSEIPALGLGDGGPSIGPLAGAGAGLLVGSLKDSGGLMGQRSVSYAPGSAQAEGAAGQGAGESRPGIEGRRRASAYSGSIG
ncbi:hypothetical protein MBLNU457_5562t1 [Dothideomycetes sp. NU457]